MNDPEKTLERLVAERRVRAVAWAGSHGTAASWAGSEPYFVTFERGLVSRQLERRAGLSVERFPYEALERWRDWDAAREEAPLALLATSRVAYDPTGHYGRIQKTLWGLSEERLAVHREELLAQAQTHLNDARGELAGPGRAVQGQLLALVEAREVALGLLYPALLSHLRLWPEFEVRLPHAWRASAGLKFPRAVYRLEHLYGFGGEDEARKVLLATRGLGLVEQEKWARAAFQSGYFDGAVRLLRDECARIHRADLAGWTHLTSTRQDRLGVLLGVTRSPLGPSALTVAQDLLHDAREGR